MTDWIIHVFHSPFNKCLLDTVSVPSIRLATGDALLRKRDMIPGPRKLINSSGIQIFNIHSKMLYFQAMTSVTRGKNRQLSASSVLRSKKAFLREWFIYFLNNFRLKGSYKNCTGISHVDFTHILHNHNTWSKPGSQHQHNTNINTDII